MSIIFNEICINEEMLPKYTYIYICKCVYLPNTSTVLSMKHKVVLSGEKLV